jgi:hypothetical protein
MGDNFMEQLFYSIQGPLGTVLVVVALSAVSFSIPVGVAFAVLPVIRGEKKPFSYYLKSGLLPVASLVLLAAVYLLKSYASIHYSVFVDMC